MIQKRKRFLWAKAHLKWTVTKWKTVLWSDESKFEVLFGKLGCHVIRTKEDKDNPSCYQRSVQKLLCWYACGMGSLHIWKGTNAEKYIQVLEQHMLPSRRRLFQGRPCIFQHDNARPHTASITTSWLRRRRIRVLKWPACSPDLSPIENIWHIIKRKMRQRRPKTVEQLKACIRQEWDNIPIPKLKQLVSSVPRRLQTVIKRRGDATQW
uniref:Tc1-like transposase DDE domain-containing protein n=1 Tax=Cyprinus carpio carpio TaxID=630221 RepID=A0A9J8BPY1_CYPCA